MLNTEDEVANQYSHNTAHNSHASILLGSLYESLEFRRELAPNAFLAMLASTCAMQVCQILLIS